MKKFFENRYIFCISSIILSFLAIPFIPKVFPRIIVVLVLAVFVERSFKLYISANSKIRAREQLKSFLELFCGRLSSGHTPENSLLSISEDLLALYGEKAYINLALKSIYEDFNRGESFDVALSKISGFVPCPESRPVFETLSKMRSLGPENIHIVRQSHSMVSELLNVTKEISSRVSQKRLESTVMATMPFLVLWSLELSVTSYMQPAFTNYLGQFIIASAFIVSILSYCLGLHIVANSVYRPKKKDSTEKLSLESACTNLFNFLVIKYPKVISILKKIIGFLPERYILSTKRILDNLDIHDKYTLEKNIFFKLCIIIFAISLFVLFGFIDSVPSYPFIILGIGLIYVFDNEMKGRIEKNKLRLINDLPGFTSLLYTLLSNGIVLERSLEMCIDTFNTSTPEFRNELKILKCDIAGGIDCCEALEKFADRCGIQEVTSALVLASQYSKSGNPHILNLFKLQTGACWIQAKIYAATNLEQSSVKLLIPMILHLICVIAITITPAVMSFRVI